MRNSTKNGRRAWAICSVLTLSACAAQRRASTVEPPPLDRITVGRLGMYSFGASGVAALPDGRIVIVEDEKLHPLVIVDLFGTGRAREFTAGEFESAFGRAAVPAPNDLEGVTIDPRGHVYATTSHAVARDGIGTPGRSLVLRFDVSGDSLAHGRATSSLDAALEGLDEAIGHSIGRQVKTRGPSPGLNIEGIAWDPRTGHLLFGLRGPLSNRDAQVVSMDNPDDVFERGAMPELSGPYLIGLEGQGIRDLSYDADLGGFLVVAGASGTSAYGHGALWRWSGPGGASPERLPASVLDPLKPEGVTAMTVRGRRIVLFVCDDGWLDTRFFSGKSRTNEGIPSGFVVIPHSMLQK